MYFAKFIWSEMNYVQSGINDRCLPTFFQLSQPETLFIQLKKMNYIMVYSICIHDGDCQTREGDGGKGWPP